MDALEHIPLNLGKIWMLGNMKHNEVRQYMCVDTPNVLNTSFSIVRLQSTITIQQQSIIICILPE